MVSYSCNQFISPAALDLALDFTSYTIDEDVGSLQICVQLVSEPPGGIEPVVMFTFGTLSGTAMGK